MIGKLWDRIQEFIGYLSGILLMAVVTLIFIQVIARYIFSYSIPWSEELSRFLFVYLIFVTLTVIIQKKMLIRIDLLDTFLKGKAKKFAQILVNILSIFILSVMVFSGYQFVQVGVISTSPGLGISLAVVYIIMPIGYLLAIIETVRVMILNIREGDEG